MEKHNIMNKELKFWNWFIEHEKDLYKLDTMTIEQKEVMLDRLYEQLQDYCVELYFQMGGAKKDRLKEFIISAAGNIKYFDLVYQLIAVSPRLENWKFLPLIPPQGCDFVTEYEGIELTPKKIWFIPLNSNKNPKQIGIQIGLSDFSILQKEESLKEAVHTMIETLIGEKSYALDLQYIGIGALPNKPETEGYIELCELTDYISWKKRKIEEHN